FPPFFIILTATALAHVVISGLATGSIYALMALALVIVYNATRTLNFAQGEMLMVSAFLAWTAHRTLGLSWWASIVIAIAGGALLGFVVERAIVRRSPTATPGDVLIITLGLSLVLRALAGMIWSHDEFPFPSLFSNRPIAVGPARLARHHRRLADAHGR